MHWQYIINLYSSNPTPQESSCSHDLALYSLSSPFHFHANGNPERFFSLSWVIVDIHSEKLMLIPSKYVRWQMSTFFYEAFGHLFVCYIFQPLAVNHPHLLHSSMRLHHSDPLYPTILCFHSDFLLSLSSHPFHAAPCPHPANEYRGAWHPPDFKKQSLTFFKTSSSPVFTWAMHAGTRERSLLLCPDSKPFTTQGNTIS